MRISRACRVDANQPAIVAALRKAGFLVQCANAIGNGFPDLIVVHQESGIARFLEVKNPSGPPSSRNLTPDQKKFHALWLGAPIAVVTTPEEAIRAARACTEETPMAQCPVCNAIIATKTLLGDHVEREHSEGKGDGKDEPEQTEESK